MKRLWPHVALAAAVLALLAGCSSAPRPNILVIVIDALRADRVDFYDTHQELTPFLDSLAQHGNVFWNAYAQSSWTSPSMASLWTSRYPSQHGIQRFDSVLAETERTLPKILKERGYITGGFSANPLVTQELGFGQGFDRYDVFPGAPKGANLWAKTRADGITRAALSWLDTLSGKPTAPKFLYLHFMEPHFPYLPPKEYFDRILDRRPNPLEERQVVYDLFFIHRERWHQADELTVRVLRDMYDAEVMHIDALLRQFFEDLQSRRFLDNSLVVVTADHGEEFLDHGHTLHGTTLYNELIHVPLLLLVPGQAARMDVRGTASLIDVAPTVLDLVGMSAPAAFEGHSWVPALGLGQRSWRFADMIQAFTRKQPAAAAPAYSELLRLANEPITPPTTHLRSIVLGNEKLIVQHDGAAESYDLGSDPSETKADGLAESDRLALQRDITRISQHAALSAAQAPTAALDDKTRARLRALGYLKP